MPENFYRPSHGRTLSWYVRLVPPAPLKGQPGVREFRKSTGTSDLRRAKAIGARLIADKLAEWDQLLAKTKAPATGPRILTADLIDHICARRLYHWMRLDDEARFDGDGYDDAAGAALVQLCQVTDQSMRSVVQRGKASPEWGNVLDVIDFWCGQIDCPVERTDPLYPQLVRAFAEVERDAAGRLLRRADGEATPTPAKPAAAGATLSAMTEPYRDYKKRNAGAKYLSTSQNIWSRLIEHLGDVPLAAVKGADLYDFLEARMRATERPWSMKHAHGLVKRTLREVFSLARTRGLLVGGNPVDDLEIMPQLTAAEERSRMKPRHPFTDTQLTTVFTSDWYRVGTVRWRGKMGKDLGARYWVPLVCLFHGNRVREVLQLVASDIGCAETIPVVHFRAELAGEQADLLAVGAARSVKNVATERVVPLHPTLCALGFVEFVQQRRQADGEHAMLFPSSIPAPGGRAPIIGRAYEQAFLRYVRDELAFGRGFGNHSFRHQLEDRIRDAQRPGQQWPAGMAQAYTGRKRLRSQDVGRIEQEGSEADYGRGYGPTLMLEYVKTLSFDKVTLPPPFAAWLADSNL
ncbi:integrase [Hydrogenophaga electricum]|uniref:Integrase n=1 Tax=Hydrogenophaga electricum TaxID=1230953 RepID=A0ABQ6C042_9BURK|nr:integrase [Hydrogenophaga electricum]